MRLLLVHIITVKYQLMGCYNNPIYKWKSPENLTIYFYLHRDGEGPWSVNVFRATKLFKMDLRVAGGNIALDELNDKIVECRLILCGKYWEPVKIRHDKLNTNSHAVAISTIDMLKNPITIEHIMLRINLPQI